MMHKIPYSKEEQGKISMFVMRELERFRSSRLEVEELWLEQWALYLGTPQAQDTLAALANKTVGEVQTQWRHRLSTGKAYELVETIVGYLMAATFPNEDWFDATPLRNEPDGLLVARLIKKLLLEDFRDKGFISTYEEWLRQLVVTGTSVMAIEWDCTCPMNKRRDYSSGYVEIVEEHGEPEGLKFSVIDSFDCYFDPQAKHAADGSFIRKIRYSKHEALEMVEKGHFYCEPEDIIGAAPVQDSSKSNADQLSYFTGVYPNADWNSSDIIEVIEFWGDIVISEGSELKVIKNHVTTILNQKVIRCEENTYWHGLPFVFGSFIPVPRQPYAMSYLQSNLGMLHQLNLITNLRLDNMTVAANQMYALRRNGILMPEDVFSAPSKVFEVEEHGDLVPLPNPGLAASVTYTESGVLEAAIDKNCGSGAYIGANNQRNGERVTAEEIAAVRDAGGNRITAIHRHIEQSATVRMLQLCYRHTQQFVETSRVLRIVGSEPGSFEYQELMPEELRDMKLRCTGSEHAIEKKQYLEERMSLLQLAGQVPQLGEALNYKPLIRDIITHWRVDDPEVYLKEESEQQSAEMEGQGEQAMLPPGPAVPPQQAIVEQAAGIGGAGLQAALQDEMAADGGMSMGQEVYGAPEEEVAF